MNSGPQMQWLLYECLGQEVLVHTDSGNPATNNKALVCMRTEWATLLIEYRDAVKEESYVSKCLESLIQGEDGEWYLHPQFKVPGTITCRLSGSGGVNLQQIPKTVGYLSCWVPTEGKVWVDCDHTALEQVVLAELSRDEGLEYLYGPNAKKNDVYLFTGAQIAGLKDKILASGYDPFNPLPEMIDRTKQLCKHERDLCKTIVLGSSYGMGWAKLQMTLKLQGIIVSEREAREMLAGYWAVYKGVKQWESELLRQYQNNNGWVLNGIGRPVGVFETKMKDIVNRVVQGTGHDVHVRYIHHVIQLFKEEKIRWIPIILDFHDQMIVEVDRNDAERVKYLMGVTAYERLNAELGGRIPLSGHAAIVNNLAEAKCA
jgi:DNA polymerase I-like protein with 3'-5' exonuclease and polymerase domains